MIIVLINSKYLKKYKGDENIKMKGDKKMKKTILVGILCMSLLVLGIMSSANALTINIDPATQQQWDTNQVSNLTVAQLAAIVGYGGTLVELYKQNAGVGGTEVGSFAPYYNTTFSGEPNGALIVWNGPLFISGNPLYLVVKDGAQGDPAQFIFNLSNLTNVTSNPTQVGLPYAWNGMDTLSLSNFWTGVQGSISHVSIYGPTSTVPEPATLLLVGGGLLGFWGLRRKFKK